MLLSAQSGTSSHTRRLFKAREPLERSQARIRLSLGKCRANGPIEDSEKIYKSPGSSCIHGLWLLLLKTDLVVKDGFEFRKQNQETLTAIKSSKSISPGHISVSS
jgi:hypothetical protein